MSIDFGGVSRPAVPRPNVECVDDFLRHPLTDPRAQLSRLRTSLALAHLEVHEIVDALNSDDDPKAMVRRMLLALGRLTPVIADLDGLLADSLVEQTR